MTEYKVVTTHGGGLTFTNTFDQWSGVLTYLEVPPKEGQSFSIERVKPKVFRKVARFTLLSYGKEAGNSKTHTKTAEEYSSAYYGHDTVQRLQSYLDNGNQSYRVVVGDIHSIIPDLKEPVTDSWGHQYSIRIDSITEEEAN